MGNVIKLGAVGALRNYSLKQQGDGIAWSRGPANPYSAKVNTSSLYDEVDAWNEWIQEDWQTGVGRVDPEEGGYLYGELDSRVPNQLVLAQGIDIYSNVPFDTSSAYKAWSLSPGQLTNSTTRATYALANNNYLAWQIRANNSGGTWTVDTVALWVYGECADNTVLRADIYSNNSNNPNASLANGSATITNDFPGPQWHKIAVVATGLADDTDYFVVLRPTTSSLTVHGVSNLSPSMTVRSSTDGSAWSSVTTFQPFFNLEAEDNTIAIDSDGLCGNIVRIVYSTHARGVAFVGQQDLSPNTVYLFSRGSYQYLDMAQGVSYDTDDAPPTDAAVFNNKIYVARGDVDDIAVVNLDLSGDTEGSVSADRLLSYGGYLWRSLGNDLYYSADVSTWTAVGIDASGIVCGDPWEIRSMAGMEGDVYCACDDGLYRIAPGNVVEGIMPWQPSSDNGKAMVSFAGALYIIVHGRVWRFGLDGRMQDIWVKRDDDLPANRLGEVISLATTDLWVVALVKSTTGRCSVWAYQDEGWHHVATLPTTAGQTMYYERSTLKLWVGTSDGYAFGVYLPAHALNPYNDPDSIYMPAGWIQQDRYYGGLYLVNKDFESVTIIGDNLSTNVNAKVYWQDEGSTAWELLGTADSDGEELRWSDHSTRPQGKWVKLGVLLQSNDADETPRIRAVVVKNLPMVTDRIRDQVTLTLEGSIEMPDGAPDAYTRAQQLTHILSLISSVIPVIYEDPFGTQYEVKITDYNMTVERFDYRNGSNQVDEMAVVLVLEQVPDSTYSA